MTDLALLSPAANGCWRPAVLPGPTVLDPDDPDLHTYDVVLINSSAGKDSQSMLTRVVALADKQNYPREKIVVVYAALGRVVWAGTRELARTQAQAYGLRFEVVERAEDLLDHVLSRHATLRAKGDTTTPAWPSSTARWCTSDHKTSQVAKLLTRLAGEHRERLAAAGGTPRPVRILNCLGMRAAESPARAKKAPFGPETSASNGRREVTRWLPIFRWSDERVWDTIRASGLPFHPAYSTGMQRLSCVMCVLATRKDLVLAASLNPDLARAYVAVEDQVGHTFRLGLSIRQVATEAGVLG